MKYVMVREVPVLFAGLAVGLSVAFATGGLLSRFLFGVAPGDLLSLSGAVGLLAAAGVAAILLAALRTLRLDPLDAIRAE